MYLKSVGIVFWVGLTSFALINVDPSLNLSSSTLPGVSSPRIAIPGMYTVCFPARFTLGSPLVLSQFVPDLLLVRPWFTLGSPLVYSQFAYGLLSVRLWLTLSSPLFLSQFAHGLKLLKLLC